MIAILVPSGAAAQPSAGDPVTPVRLVAEEPRWYFEPAFIVGKPTGDLDREKTSWGFDVLLGRTVARNVSLLGGLRYIDISTDREFANEKYVLAHGEVFIGARYSIPLLQTLEAFGEGRLGLVALSVNHPEFAGGDALSASAVGLGLRAGMLVRLHRQFSIGSALGCSWARVDFRGANIGTFGDARGDSRPVADAWLTFDVMVHAAF